MSTIGLPASSTFVAIRPASHVSGSASTLATFSFIGFPCSSTLHDITSCPIVPLTACIFADFSASIISNLPSFNPSLIYSCTSTFWYVLFAVSELSFIHSFCVSKFWFLDFTLSSYSFWTFAILLSSSFLTSFLSASVMNAASTPSRTLCFIAFQSIKLLCPVNKNWVYSLDIFVPQIASLSVQIVTGIP